MDIKPYEISIWRDWLDETDKTIYKEQKIAVIGSNSMAADCRAVSPKLTKNINGSITLSFVLYTHYFDIDQDDFVENPYIKLISNETKIKLKYDNEWYDFIIKNIEEDSDSKSFSYTAEALFINELAKNGFGLVFNTELENSTGSIQELVEETLKGTDWSVDTENSELIQQTNEEPLYIATLNELNSLEAHYKIFNGTEEPIIEDVTIPENSTIYICYSTITDRDPLFQFFWREDGEYEIDDDNIIINSKCYYIGNYDFNRFNTDFITQIEDLAISEYRGKRLVLSGKTVWDTRLNRFVDVYEKNDDEYYGYTNTEYVTTDLVFNLVTNPSEFQSFTGWEIDNPLNLSAEIYPKIMEEGTYNPNSTSYLKVISNSNTDFIYNTGFTDNRKRFIPSDEYAGGLTAGSRYVLDYSIFSNIEEKIAATPTIYVSTYKIEGTSVQELNRIITFNSSEQKYYRIAVTADTYDAENTYYIHTASGFEQDTSGTFDANKLYYSLKSFYIGEVTHPLSYSDLLSTKVGIFIKFRNSGTFWIEKVNIFQYQEDTYGGLVTVDPIAIQGFYQIHYFYFNVAQNEDKTDAQDIISYESIGPDSSYTKIYDELHTKRRAYENSESNRFNIIQDLCELFECWAEFKIEHDDDGSIAYDDDGRLKKSVIIKNFIGKDNFSGFKYGINLKQVKRDLDSAELVTKIIVKDNANEFAEDGFCSISRAKENPCGENFLYDFRHYYNTGLLNYSQVLNDLYVYTPNYTEVGTLTWEDFNEALYGSYYIFDGFQYKKATQWDSETVYYIDEGTSNGWLGYYKRMKSINQDRQDIIKKQSKLYTTIIDLESSLQVYENLKDESAKEFNEIVNTQINVFNEPFKYEDYIAPTAAQLYWQLGILSQEVFNKYKPFYIKNGSTYIEATSYSSGTVYYAGKATKYPNEEALGGYFEARTFGEMLESLKDYNKMAAYLASAQLAEKKAKHATEMYNEYYKALYGNGVDPIAEGYFEGAQREYDRYSKYIEDIKIQKEALNALFYAKYSRFIQEGSWTDDNYIDDNLYLYDAQSTLATSAQPKVTYTISVIEISQIEDYEGYTFDVGDKTYMEDTEFFGWIIKDAVKTPYREEVFITEVIWNLNSPENNTITVQNYKTRFEDLFQRITATTTSLEFAQGNYARAAAAVETNGAISASSLQASFSQNAITLSNIKDQTVVWDNTGITISTPTDPNHIVRIVNQGIYMFDGNNWNLGISGDGINANYINAGQIDTSKIRIMNSGWTTFMWDTNGITAYAFSPSGDSINVALDKFVRLDQYGIYGINGKAEFLANSLKDIIDNAIFGLTWNGFFLNSIHGDKRISISSDNDIQILIPDERSEAEEGAIIERVKLGLIDVDNDIYGLLLRDNLNQKTLYTGSSGELWLSQAMTVASDENNNPIVKIGYGAGDTIRGDYKEVIHAGLSENSQFIVYEDGYLSAAGGSFKGEINATSGKIGNVTIDAVADAVEKVDSIGYTVDIDSNLGTAVTNKACPILTCHVYHNGVELPTTEEPVELTYQWLLEDTIIAGAIDSYYIVTSGDWEDTDVLKYSCNVTITQEEIA